MQRTIFKIKQNQVSLQTARSQFFGKLKQAQNQTFSVSQRYLEYLQHEKDVKKWFGSLKRWFCHQNLPQSENLDCSVAHGKGYIGKFPINWSYPLFSRFSYIMNQRGDRSRSHHSFRSYASIKSKLFSKQLPATPVWVLRKGCTPEASSSFCFATVQSISAFN